MAEHDARIRTSLRLYAAHFGKAGWAVIACLILGELATIALFIWGMWHAPKPDGMAHWIWLLFSLVIIGLTVVSFIAFHRLRISMLGNETEEPTSDEHSVLAGLNASIARQRDGGIPDKPDDVQKWIDRMHSFFLAAPLKPQVAARWLTAFENVTDPSHLRARAKYAAMGLVLTKNDLVTYSDAPKPRVEHVREELVAIADRIPVEFDGGRAVLVGGNPPDSWAAEAKTFVRSVYRADLSKSFTAQLTRVEKNEGRDGLKTCINGFAKNLSEEQLR